MTRSFFAASLLVGFLCFALYSSAEEGNTASANPEIQALKTKRIALLEARVATCEKYFAASVADRSDVVDSQVDLISAKIAYADSKHAKKKLYSELLNLYDWKIESAQLAAQAPQIARENNARNRLDSEADLLQLKSERIRTQIERELLGP